MELLVSQQQVVVVEDHMVLHQEYCNLWKLEVVGLALKILDQFVVVVFVVAALVVEQEHWVAALVLVQQIVAGLMVLVLVVEVQSVVALA